MISDKGILIKVKEVSRAAPDPNRAEVNLLRLIEAASEPDCFFPYLKETAKLFSSSQFLANYCSSYPDELFSALKKFREPVTKKQLMQEGDTAPAVYEGADLSDIMKRLRLFKKRHLLRITLGDLSGETDTLSSMDELTVLAEVIIHYALQASLIITSQKYGDLPPGEELSLIALGKLGGEELNYSSDVDLMAVYFGGGEQTSGVLSPSGVRINRISDSEFHFRVVELFNRMLSNNTEDGIAYRVDLRLRPQGEKGEIALPLDSYRTYYETWGRTWERMALIRARHVAGSLKVGKSFMGIIEPFVWKKGADYSDIEEIRALKKKIDSSFSKDDIKRGYGGIREAEFFVQTFQLIYGHEYEGLRTHRLLNAIQSLRWLGLVPKEDLVTLWDNYLYLRKLEHFLQMKDDLQTHSLPSSETDVKSIAIKAGFPSAGLFLSDLRVKRMKIRNMYNSLLGTEEDVHAEALTLLESDLSDDELAGYISFRGLNHPAAGLINLKGIREQFELFKTQRERSVMRRAIPLLIEKALSSENPDRGLKGLESFFTASGIKETHLTGLLERRELLDGVIKIFSLSTCLSRVFLSSPRYLDILLEKNVIRKTLRKTKEELRRNISHNNLETKIAEYKNVEEIRLGSFFLMRVLRVHNLVKALSHLAEAVIEALTVQSAINVQPSGGFAVIGMGKLGGREITFGSDLDIIFLSEKSDILKSAEKILKTVTAYTDKGMIYNVDTRLRPDGTKGTLLKDIEGYRSYYMKHAHPWEIQALLKARPVAGDCRLAQAFMEMAREVAAKRGSELTGEDVKATRGRIVRELSRESEGIDIKLGYGGTEEIEFFIQRLQLNNVKKFPELFVQDTVSAIRRLTTSGIISAETGKTLRNAYEYLRTLQTLMRLNEEGVITEGSEFTPLAAAFMGHRDKDEFLDYLGNIMNETVTSIGGYS